MSATSNLRVPKYPPGFHFWRAMILTGGILLIGMYSFSAVGFVYVWFRPIPDWGYGPGPTTIGAVIVLVFYVFVFLFILANRLPRKYAKSSPSNQFDPQHEANS
jgi:hypothetical protein